MVEGEENLFHIYGIKNDLTDKFFYIGCTTQELHRRLYQHANDSNSAAYGKIQEIGENNVSIVLLKDYYGMIEEAHFIEGEYTKLYNEDNELFNKKFGDVYFEGFKTKIKKPKKQSHGVEVLLKYANQKPV